MMRRIVEVYTCDMCKKKVEAWNDSANARAELYNDNFLRVSVESINYDVCKKCARTLTFIPEVLL